MSECKSHAIENCGLCFPSNLSKVLVDADKLVSVIHDRIYAEPFDKKAASDAVWDLHHLLRNAIGAATN